MDENLVEYLIKKIIASNDICAVQKKTFNHDSVYALINATRIAD